MKIFFFSISLFLTISCSETNKDSHGSKNYIKAGDNRENNNNEIAILPAKQLIELSQQNFKNYEKKLLTKTTKIGFSDAYTGDFTNDGKEDVVIYYSLEPNNGGNYLVGQGLIFYKNVGDNVDFITAYNPDYLFSFDRVSGGNIFISKNEYAEDDPRCCPSINKKIELTLVGDKVYERSIR